MANVEMKLVMRISKRWWFQPARIATIILILVGAVTDTDRAAAWLARNGLKYRVSAN